MKTTHFLILIFSSIFSCSYGKVISNKIPLTKSYVLESGLYKSNCHPGENIYQWGEAGRNWFVTFITWEKNGIKKEYTLPTNQTNGLGNSERLILDKKNSNIFRLKKTNKILLTITGEKSFKTDDGCEWKFISDEYFLSDKIPSQNSRATNKKEIFYNNYDGKYYHKGTLFSGVMKSNFNEITFKEGLPNGVVKSFNKQGKVYRKLNFIDGKFEGDFFTENFNGTFLNDTLIDRLKVYNNGKLYRDYSFSLIDKTESKESISYYGNGKVEMKGLLICHKLSSFEMKIRINDFIQGDYFLESDYMVNLPKMERNNTYLYTHYYDDGNLFYKQNFIDSSFIGYVQYHPNGIISDSLVTLFPLNIFETSMEEYPDEYLTSVRNRVYYKFDEKGRLRSKNTEIQRNYIGLFKTKTDDINKPGDDGEVVDNNNEITYIKTNNDVDQSGYPIGENLGEYFDTFDNGLTKYKWFFNENFKLDGEYLEFYKNGKLKIKTSLTNGKLNPLVDFYRENGTKRLSFYKLNEEYIFEEYFLDGNVKFKEHILGSKVINFLDRLSSKFRIGESTNEEPYITEEDNLFKQLTY